MEAGRDKAQGSAHTELQDKDARRREPQDAQGIHPLQEPQGQAQQDLLEIPESGVNSVLLFFDHDFIPFNFNLNAARFLKREL